MQTIYDEDGYAFRKNQWNRIFSEFKKFCRKVFEDFLDIPKPKRAEFYKENYPIYLKAISNLKLNQIAVNDFENLKEEFLRLRREKSRT